MGMCKPSLSSQWSLSNLIQECGDELYADFEKIDPRTIDELEWLLKSDDVIEFEDALYDSPAGAEGSGSSNSPQQASTHNTSPSSASPSLAVDGAASSANPTNASPGISTAQRTPDPTKIIPRYLALWINTRSIYKTLVEFDVSERTSDADVFYMLKDAYVNLRGLRSLYGFLMKPVDVHFVHVSS